MELPETAPPFMEGRNKEQARLDTLVKGNLMARMPTPVTPETVLDTVLAITMGRVQKPRRLRLSLIAPGEYGLGSIIERPGLDDVPAHVLHVNNALLGSELWVMDDLNALYSTKPKGGMVELTEPVIAAIIEHAAQTETVIETENGTPQNPSGVVNALIGQAFQEEARVMIEANRHERADRMDYMPLFRRHLAGVVAGELVNTRQVDWLLHPDRPTLAKQLNDVFEEAGMIRPFRPDVPDPFHTVVDLDTEILVSMLWEIGRRDKNKEVFPGRRSEHYPDKQQGPNLIARFIYPSLALEGLRQHYRDNMETDAVSVAQAKLSLMGQGVGEGDQFWRDRLDGMLASMLYNEDKTGGVSALMRAGKILHSDFMSLDEAKLNLRAVPDMTLMVPGAVPYRRPHGISRNYTDHRVKRVEFNGRTSVSLVYAEGDFVNTAMAALGVPGDASDAFNSEIPWMEVHATLADDSLRVRAKIMGTRDRTMLPPQSVLKSHTAIFAEALHMLSENQLHGKIELLSGWDSSFGRTHRSMDRTDSYRLAQFVQTIASGQMARLTTPLDVVVASRQNPMMATVETVPPGGYRRRDDKPVSPQTMLIPFRGDNGYSGSVHYQALMRGRFEGIEQDGYGIMPVYSRTASDSTMPTLEDGIRLMAEADYWKIEKPSIVFRANPTLPAMRIHGQVVHLDKRMPGTYYLAFNPLISHDSGFVETYNLWNDRQGQEAADKVVAAYKQSQMFGRAEMSAFDDGIRSLQAMGGQAQLLGRRLSGATITGGLTGG